MSLSTRTKVSIECMQYERGLQHAGSELYSAITKGANETEKFTQIFRTAPVWLLEFTWMRLDAELLKFDLPKMTDKQVWGEKGLEDMMRWPLLPLGMMTDGRKRARGHDAMASASIGNDD
jgi:hypothetical protein